MLIQALSPIRPLQMSMAWQGLPGVTSVLEGEDEDINLLAGDRVEQRFTNRGLKGGLAKIMLQSSLDWFRKLVVWSGLECETYIIKPVRFGFAPVLQTATRLTSSLVLLRRRRPAALHAGRNRSA